MNKRPNFDVNKCVYRGGNPVFISGLLDPFTAKIARFVYNLGFSANAVTIISFVMGMSAIALMLFMNNYTGLVIAAILITIRNIGDTIDGKIARGSGQLTPVGGFLDIIVDWIFFHAAFFIAIGFITNNVAVGFLCVTGYMGREFTRRKFTERYGTKITETNEAKSLPLIVSLVRKYDLASAFWIIPILMIFNQLALIIYAIAIVEYSLLFGELGFDFVCFAKQRKSINKK